MTSVNTLQLSPNSSIVNNSQIILSPTFSFTFIFHTATENESFEESDQSDNEDELAASDKDVLNESFGLKSLLEEDSNKQSQVCRIISFILFHKN